MSGVHHGNNINYGNAQNVGAVFHGSGQSATPEPTRAAAGWREPLVFVNYRYPDVGAATDIEAELIRRLGPGSVFRDAGMLAGTEFPRELADKAASCRVMVSVIGERWDDTYALHLLHDPADWVRREIALALARDVHLVPVMVGARGRLVPGDLPEDIRKLAHLQAPHLRRGYGPRDVEQLVDDLIRDLTVVMESVFRGR
jgi:hypothetical protein